MMSTKHAIDRVVGDNGLLAWGEPAGPTRGLQEWCLADEVVSAPVPPCELTGRFFQRGN